MSFAVVSFEDGSISEVPSKWLVSNNTKTWWPPTKNVSNLIARTADPEASWTKYKISVERFCDSLATARKAAEDSNYCSSQSEDRGKGQRYRKPNRRYEEDTSSDEEGGDRIKLPPIPTVEDGIYNLKKNGSLEKIGDLCGTSEIISSEVSQASSGPDHSTPSILSEGSQDAIGAIGLENTRGAEAGIALDGHSNNIEKRLIEILRKVSMIELEIMDLKNIIEKSNSIGAQIDEIHSIRECFPIRSIGDLRRVEELLEIEQKKRMMVVFLSKIGGLNPKDSINRILKMVFANSFAVECSWLGLRNNFKISSSPLIFILKEIIHRTYPSTTEKEIDMISSEWFRHAKQRLQRQN